MTSFRRMFVAILLACTGCGVGEVDDALIVATTWPAQERAEWEQQVRNSKAATPIRWLVLAPGDDLARVATRVDPPDLILGAPAATCEMLARRGLLEPGPRGGKWEVAAVRDLGYVTTVAAPPPAKAIAPGDVPSGLTFDDPRADPTALTWSKAVLAADKWLLGYAKLVQAARGPRIVGRQPGAGHAAVERGEAAATPAVVPIGYEYTAKHTGLLLVDKQEYQFELIAAVRRARQAVTAAALIDELALGVSIATPVSRVAGLSRRRRVARGSPRRDAGRCAERAARCLARAGQGRSSREGGGVSGRAAAVAARVRREDPVDG